MSVTMLRFLPPRCTDGQADGLGIPMTVAWSPHDNPVPPGADSRGHRSRLRRRGAKAASAGPVNLRAGRRSLSTAEHASTGDSAQRSRGEHKDRESPAPPGMRIPGRRQIVRTRPATP